MAHENEMKFKASVGKVVLGPRPARVFACPTWLLSRSEGVLEDVQQGPCSPQSPRCLLCGPLRSRALYCERSAFFT